MLKNRGRIIWLASYPKSGNTWVRIVLGGVVNKGKIASSLDNLPIQDGIASDREIFDNIVPVESSSMPFDLIDTVRPLVYQTLSDECRETRFIKVHDAYHTTVDNVPIFPEGATRGIVHIVRNPLDIAVSLSNHYGLSLDDAVLMLCDKNKALCDSQFFLLSQFRQKLFDWSGHTKSWLSCPLPRVTVRYEDILSNPKKCFLNIIKFCGLTVTDDLLDRLLAISSISSLQKMERTQGFRERFIDKNYFFRNGVAGEGRLVLGESNIDKILECHGALMSELGYIQ